MMLVIGLVGGIASGKSLVAKCFGELGAVVLDADSVGHQVLLESGVKKQIQEIWGDKVFHRGEVDRSAVAAIVFNPQTGPEELVKLEKIVHPVITVRLIERLTEFRRLGKMPAVILDAPVMFKAGWDALCDRIVFVDAPDWMRTERAMRRGWSKRELQRRESRQMSLNEKRSRATDFIDNSQSPEMTLLQVKQLWQQWRLPLPKTNYR
jgi:dephospho-CoA kinase